MHLRRFFEWNYLLSLHEKKQIKRKKYDSKRSSRYLFTKDIDENDGEVIWLNQICPPIEIRCHRIDESQCKSKMNEFWWKMQRQMNNVTLRCGDPFGRGRFGEAGLLESRTQWCRMWSKRRQSLFWHTLLLPWRPSIWVLEEQHNRE